MKKNKNKNVLQLKITKYIDPIFFFVFLLIVNVSFIKKLSKIAID